MLDNEDVLESMATQESTLLNLPNGVPPLTSLYLYISGSCNLACRHCWIVPNYLPDGNINGGLFVKLEYVEKAVREAKPLGLRSIKLTGGEPTLHPQFRELVSLIHAEGVAITMETNGLLINDELALFLRENKVSFVSVSLDGATKGVHEELRNVASSYERAINGIKSLVRAGFSPQMICTLHQGNIHEISEIVTLASHLGCGSIKFNHIQSTGRGENFAKDHGLGVEKILEIYRFIENNLVPKSSIPIFFHIPIAFFSIRKLVRREFGRCEVQNILGMLASGELSLCGIGTTKPDLIFGHINKDDLRKVWYYSTGLTQLRELIPSHLEGICAQCIHRDLCQGECVASNFDVTGKLNASFAFCSQAEALGVFPTSRKISR